MDIQELKYKSKSIYDDAFIQIKEIRLKYAKSIQKFNIGDIVEYNGNIIKIDDIKYNLGSNIEQYDEKRFFPVYYGFVLTKKFENRKDNKRDYVGQNEYNDIKKIN